jgi:hypothetical protein
LETIKKKGRELEARTLLNGVRLAAGKKVEVYWGKVHFKKTGGSNPNEFKRKFQ